VTNRLLALAVAAPLVLAGCDRQPPHQASPSPVALEKLMRGAPAPAKPPPLRLAPLRPGDVGADFAGKPACRFTHGADTLLVAAGGAALARVDGQLLRIRQAAPVDSTGAFFQGPDVSISVGGRDPRLGPGPAGVTITGAGGDPAQKAEGVWSCPG
jgi:hypothetical protein